MTWIDLTHSFDAAMPVYPGDPHSSLRKIAGVETEGFTDHQLQTGMHVGTHMDAPLHMIENGAYLSDIPVDRFAGRGRLVDVRDQPSVSEHLLDGVAVERGDVVIVLTGFSRRFHQESYYLEYPELSQEFAQRMIDLGASIVAMDTPSPDRAPFPVHKMLLGSGILIIENLTNVEALLGIPRFTVYAFPMKLRADAAPVRVVAKIE